MRVDIRRFACALACCAAGPVVALSVAAAAVAEPATPAVPPAPGPAPAPPAQTAQAPQASAAEPGVPASGPTVGTPHLASPEALPPGSTMDPTGQGTETPNLSYLKDLWHAVQNQEISGKEALILGIAQRGMNTPVPNQAPGPNVPHLAGRSGSADAAGSADAGRPGRSTGCGSGSCACSGRAGALSARIRPAGSRPESDQHGPARACAMVCPRIRRAIVTR